MKKKLSITLATMGIASITSIMPILSSCQENKPTKLSIDIEGSKWGYIISVAKPYYEYTLTLSNGFKDGDLLEMEIVNPSITDKIQLETSSIKIDGDDVNSIKFKIEPDSYDPTQDPFSVNFSLKIAVKREGKEIYSTQINSLIFDAVLPATDPNFYTYEDQEKTILTGINEEKYSELLKTGCLVIPSSVKKINKRAFSITPSTSDKLKAIYNSNKWILLDYSVYDDSKPCNLEEIGDEAFFQNTYFIDALYIPNTVKTIGQSAFARCSGFNEIKFASNSNIKSISTMAFFEMKNVVKTFELPKNEFLKELPRGLFTSNSAESYIPCKGIIIPSNIEITYDPVFMGFSNLLWVDVSDFNEVPTGWAKDTFHAFMPTTGTIYVKNEQLIQGWKDKLGFVFGGWDFVVKGEK